MYFHFEDCHAHAAPRTPRVDRFRSNGDLLFSAGASAGCWDIMNGPSFSAIADQALIDLKNKSRELSMIVRGLAH
jgi:hypothetical protein